VSWHSEEIAENALLDPGWQAAQLVNDAAYERVPVGQLFRCLICQLLRQRGTENAHQEFEVLAR
jgi:hypothetical protein